MKQQQAVSTLSSDRSLAGWFRRLFAPSANKNGTAAPKPVETSAGPQAAPTNTQISPESVSAWTDCAPDFAPFAQALGLEFALPVSLADSDEALAAQLTAAVMETASKDDSGLKSLPTASLRILNLVARNDVEVTELATAIQKDPALAAAVLRVANSAALGPSSGPVNTVREAVLRLGVAESGRVAGAVAAKTLFSAKSKSTQAMFSQQFAELHLTAASAAGGAAYLAMTRAVGRSDLAYLGGMLHDVGKSLALGALANLVVDNRAPRELPPAVVDHILEKLHVELGAQAHERWTLPQYLTALCASHHDENVPNHPSQAEVHLVRAVSGLLAIRARAQPLERVAELTQSLGVLGLTPLQTRALDAELRRNTARLRDALT